MIDVAFIMHGEKGETVHVGGDAWQVTQILVIAADVGQGYQPITPTIQWSAFHLDEQAA